MWTANNTIPPINLTPNSDRSEIECRSCRKKFEPKNKRGKKPKVCYDCRPLSWMQKEAHVSKLITDFLITPGNAVIAFASGYLHIISGNRKVIALPGDLVAGIQKLNGGGNVSD